MQRLLECLGKQKQNDLSELIYKVPKFQIETQEMRILGNRIVEATQTDDLMVLVALSLDILACHTATRLESNCPMHFEKQRFMS